VFFGVAGAGSEHRCSERRTHASAQTTRMQPHSAAARNPHHTHAHHRALLLQALFVLHDMASTDWPSNWVEKSRNPTAYIMGVITRAARNATNSYS
jgi:hypothetical protein